MRAAPSCPARSRPSNAIVPAVGFSCNRISCDVVVLPQPDSPMSPSVSLCWIAKLTPSTALTNVRTRASNPCRTGKSLVSPRTSRTGDAIFHEPAAGHASVVDVNVARLVRRTARQRVGAAGMEGASGRAIGEIRRLARDRVERILAAELRHRADQRARVRMLRIVEQRTHRRLLDDAARV